MLQRHRSYASMSRNADALQMQIALQMQNADARCRMQNANAERIVDANCNAGLQIRTTPGDISNGLRARGAGPDLIAHAHSAGPGNAGPRALGDVGPRLLGGLWAVSWRCPGDPF